ncbi:MAG: GTP-binding protein [Bryobacteraceae bacterium]
MLVPSNAISFPRNVDFRIQVLSCRLNFQESSLVQYQKQIIEKAKFVLIGGFLGAGKTTAIGLLVRSLKERGLHVGLITNDQGQGLVDSALARQRTSSMAEITGGCFCCRLDEVVAAVQKMTVEERPDVFLAEPVGSCTDLMATVLLPLKQVYQVPLRLAALAVLLDGRRAFETLIRGGRTRTFSKDVGYIYRKQIEEAEMLVINKIDLLTAKQLETLVASDKFSASPLEQALIGGMVCRGPY